MEFGKMCFLQGIIHKKKNPLTYHHIVPKRQGGKGSIENGALLCRIEHDMFNIIESANPKKAEDLNDGFQEFKRQRDLRTLKQMREFVLWQLCQMGYCIDDTKPIIKLRRM